MSFHPQVSIGADSTIGIQRQTGCRQPAGALASGAEQAGSVMVPVIVDQGNPRPLQYLLEVWIQLSAALLQLQRSLRPAAA